MKKMLFSILLFFMTITNVISSELKMPVSGISVDIPDGYALYQVELGTYFGKSDLITNEVQSLVITFMKPNGDLQVNSDMVAGIRDGMVKGGYKTSEIMIDVHQKGKIKVLKAQLGNEVRVYIPYAHQNLIILAQIEGEKPELPAVLIHILSSIK
ncbi:hypothetical protein [Neptunomonas antarctica]|uniref:DUF1795 domain-containing protein n=1 Tax=Neptunomonas antarctica TaxID=619304 RepID=A0A1N7LPE8_9GAMM|nr:hypothetical protein [Neptunomonas antarctica]SIS75717.1 hypothetical protein SAMN05421760_104217 [Neptunomonas antarctica]